MQSYAELVPPSGVTHAVRSHFTGADSNNLIVARTSVLQVFSLKQTIGSQDTKLVLVAEERLAGTITSLGSVKTLESKSGGEALLIAFRDAKLSLVEWDPYQYCISTISIHYYENDDFLRCPWAPDLRDCPSRLAIDPSSRCAALNFGIGNLAVIPFHQTQDDLIMDDFEEVEQQGQNGSTYKHSKNMSTHAVPYASSFVLPLTALDSSILHPVEFAFLYEYREPTIGVLFSTSARSANLLPERKDVLTYAVYTLDLEQKASINLMVIPRLPNDLHSVVALPLPVGGTLLVGSNEVVHVDQGGKSTAIGVNEFARQLSSFSMADRSDLGMKLEGCKVQDTGNEAGDMILLLASGELVLLEFRLDGRSVSSMSLQRILSKSRSDTVQGTFSCSANLDLGKFFIGSEEGDSVLIGTAKKTSQLRRQSSRGMTSMDTDANEIRDGVSEAEGESNADDDDDLYGETSNQAVNGGDFQSNHISGANLRILDRLPCLGPMRDVTFGRHAKRKRENDDTKNFAIGPDLELAIASGRGSSGGISLFSRELSPQVISREKYDNLTGVWSFPVKRFKKENQRDHHTFDDHVILSTRKPDGAGESALYNISDGILTEKEGTEFDVSAGATIEIGNLRGGNHTIQVLENEVRVYDLDFGLAQIWPINDEESERNTKAVKACILEPVVLILKDDATLLFLKADSNGELDELELPEPLAKERYISMTLYNDVGNFFNTQRFYRQKAHGINGNLLLGLLNNQGKFSIFSLPNITIEVFSFDGLPFMPSLLANDVAIPKHWKHKDSISEVILADIGDEDHSSPFLAVKNEVDDLSVYAPFSVPDSVGTFKFRKVASKVAKASPDIDSEQSKHVNYHSSLRPLKKIGGFSSVISTGQSPMLVVKNSSSALQIHSIRANHIVGVSKHHGLHCPYGIIFVEKDGSLYKAQLPIETCRTQSDWLIRKITLNQDVSSITFYQRTGSYIVATNESHEFQLPQDDEWHPEWQGEDAHCLPCVQQSSLKLINPLSQRIVSEHSFDAAERVLCIETMSLEVSEVSHERKELVVVGTAFVKGESIATRGNIYIFDVVDVVPVPDIPDTDLRLKVLCKEDVKGAVSAVSPLGSQGFFLAAQGQKCMVRGLKEDLTILPVAFMDMRYYVKVATELPGTGLLILGDGFSGLWLTGYSEEPYKLQLLSRDIQDLEVQAASFLPDDKQLYIISVDSDGQLRVLQYDPENPRTERGVKLLQRSTFHTGSTPTTMTLLPRTPVSTELPANLAPPSTDEQTNDMELDNIAPPKVQEVDYARHQILITNVDGSLSLITPLSDATYRRLSALQNLLITQLEHPCSLNPRAYRRVETDGVGGLAMIDGNLVGRWKDQSTQQRSSMANKVGGTVWDLRADLESIGGAGLGFL